MSKRTESEIIAEVEKVQTLGKDDLRRNGRRFFGLRMKPNADQAVAGQ
jgi:hypothetical protein